MPQNIKQHYAMLHNAKKSEKSLHDSTKCYTMPIKTTQHLTKLVNKTQRSNKPLQAHYNTIQIYNVELHHTIL